jgi:hypothetical protein
MFDYQQISIIETASLMYVIMRLNAIVKKDSNEDSMKIYVLMELRLLFFQFSASCVKFRLSEICPL